MAILGDSGRLVLQREPPDPSVVTPADLYKAGNSFMLPDGQAVWSGDKVILSSDTGLPFFDDAGKPLYQGGTAIWCDTTWQYHDGWDKIGATDSVWCSPQSPDPPWGPCETASAQTLEFYAHVDDFGRISFYESYKAAINGKPSQRVPIANVNFKSMTITTAELPWKCMCLIRSWSLELDAPAVDVTGLNTKFGENVKSLVTAGGDIDYMLQLSASERIDNMVTLLRLLFMTEKGSRAKAQFWTSTGRTAGMCATGDCGELLDGDIYYEADILVVGNALNLVPTEVVGGSVRFVATGPIALKVGDGTAPSLP